MGAIAEGACYRLHPRARPTRFDRSNRRSLDLGVSRDYIAGGKRRFGLAAVIFALVAGPVAVASGAGAEVGATERAASGKQIAKLKK